MSAKIGQKAPNLSVSKWVQGLPTNFDQEKDNVILVEVFQVNCPGCFMHGIPEAIDIYKKYRKDGVTVLGLATAFEDYDKNTLENLEKLLTTGEVIGDTLQALGQYGTLDGGKLSYKIPFPVGMDKMVPFENPTHEKVLDFIKMQIPLNLINGNFTFFLDEKEIFPKVYQNDRISFITLEFEGKGDHVLEVIGTTYLPEFSEIAPIILGTSLFGLILLRKIHKIKF